MLTPDISASIVQDFDGERVSGYHLLPSSDRFVRSSAYTLEARCWRISVNEQQAEGQTLTGAVLAAGILAAKNPCLAQPDHDAVI